METIKPQIEDYPGEHIALKVDHPDMDFAEAKDLARKKALEMCADPMLLSWYQGKTGKSYPNLECGPGDRPAWIVYAASRGGNLTIDINSGQYVFIYLSSINEYEA
ncbi:MAG: AF1514 family protein [Desulfobacterales bacterium]|jgi:hypothetical protein